MICNNDSDVTVTTISKNSDGHSVYIAKIDIIHHSIDSNYIRENKEYVQYCKKYL